jgi:hypothetical protein
LSHSVKTLAHLSDDGNWWEVVSDGATGRPLAQSAVHCLLH